MQPACAQWSLAKHLRKLPAPGVEHAEVAVKVLDALTAKQPEPIVRVLSKGFTTEDAVVVAKETIDVLVRGEQSNWRGTVTVEMTVPCKVHYAVDLRTVPAGKCRWDAKKLVLYVPMPELSIYAVEAMQAKDVAVRYGAARFGFWDSGTATEIENRLLKESLDARVRQVDAVKQSFALQAARDGLRQHLRGILQVAIPGVEVIVE